MFMLCSGPSPFTEGVFRRRSVGGAGRRRPQPWLVTTAREARSPSAPDEGAAFNGWTRSDEGQRQCCLDGGSGKLPPVRSKKHGDRDKNPAVERRKACVPVTRHAGAFAKVPSLTCAVSALRLPQGRQRNPGESPGGRDKVIWQSARSSRGAESVCVGFNRKLETMT